MLPLRSKQDHGRLAAESAAQTKPAGSWGGGGTAPARRSARPAQTQDLLEQVEATDAGAHRMDQPEQVWLRTSPANPGRPLARNIPDTPFI